MDRSRDPARAAQPEPKRLFYSSPGGATTPVLLGHGPCHTRKTRKTKNVS